MHTSITYQRISQLQDGFSMVYGKVFGEQAPQMATNISNEELKKSVEELKERFDKTFGSLEDVIDKLNNNHKQDQEDLK